MENIGGDYLKAETKDMKLQFTILSDSVETVIEALEIQRHEIEQTLERDNQAIDSLESQLQEVKVNRSFLLAKHYGLTDTLRALKNRENVGKSNLN